MAGPKRKTTKTPMPAPKGRSSAKPRPRPSAAAQPSAPASPKRETAAAEFAAIETFLDGSFDKPRSKTAACSNIGVSMRW